jgi:phosphatidate cytidylyltransferase
VLRTRFFVSIVLITIAVGVLLGDSYLAPWYPCLLATVWLLGFLGCRELRAMLPEHDRPSATLTHLFVPLMLLASWYHTFTHLPVHPDGFRAASPWTGILAVFVAAVLTTFIYEILTYSADGRATTRIAFTILSLVYFGLLPSCLVQLRWRADGLGGIAIAATIFVPKVGDIFALLTGLVIGKHRFTPLLSPKKTWEGFVGGMVAAIVVAVGFHNAVPTLFRAGLWQALAFGVGVGLAGVFGDLAESLVKRDCGVKDASKSIPGFGGVLDLIDSVLFAAPIAYVILRVGQGV